MKRAVLWLILILSGCLARAQTLSDFLYLDESYSNKTYMGVSVSSVHLFNNKIPDGSNYSAKGFMLDMNIRQYHFGKRGFNYQWDYKLVFDLIFLTKQMIDRKSNGNRSIASTVSCGILGWHHFSWNIAARDKWCLGAGFALNDYFVGTTYYDTLKKELITPEPQGWYIASGPAISSSYSINKFLALHGQLCYVLGFSRPVSITYATVNNDYPKPHFFGANIQLLSKWGLYAEAQFAGLVNRGNIPSAQRRLDLKLGFNFIL